MPNALSRELAQGRWRAKLSMAQLSSLTDVPAEMIGALEAGDLNVPVVEVFKLVHALDLDTEELLKTFAREESALRLLSPQLESWLDALRHQRDETAWRLSKVRCALRAAAARRIALREERERMLGKVRMIGANYCLGEKESG